MTAPAGTTSRGTLLRRSTDVLGKCVPNLVLEYDSGEPMIEFRVQLEVPLDSAKATDVRTALAARNEPGLAAAKRIVLESIGECATPMFRQIVGQAFDDNIDNIRMQKS